MKQVFKRPKALVDIPTHFCPGCHHGIIHRLVAECIDRYGVMPEEAANLLLKIMLKVLSMHAGVKRLDLNGSNLALAFSTTHQQNPSAIVDLIVSEPRKYPLTPEHVLKVKLSAIENNGFLAQVKNILKEIAQHVNNLTFEP